MKFRIGIGKYELLSFETAPKGGTVNYNQCAYGQPFPIMINPVAQSVKQGDVDGNIKASEPIAPSDNLKEVAKRISKEVKLEIGTIEYILMLAQDHWGIE